MNRVIHFEIQADKPERAIKFYEDIFGWKIEQWGSEKYWMVMTAEKDSKEMGINGGLLPRPVALPAKECGANSFVCTVMVENFDKTAKKIMDAGGTVAMPKFAITNMAWQGYFIDTEGNTFGVHEPDKKAK
ncbi:MAG: VOC family protein [Candidatus Paceibacterota bacterium]